MFGSYIKQARKHRWAPPPGQADSEASGWPSLRSSAPPVVAATPSRRAALRRLPCNRRAARLDAARDGVVNYLPAKLNGAEGQLLEAAMRERRKEERSLRAAFGTFALIALQQVLQEQRFGAAALCCWRCWR